MYYIITFIIVIAVISIIDEIQWKIEEKELKKKCWTCQYKTVLSNNSPCYQCKKYNNYKKENKNE